MEELRSNVCSNEGEKTTTCTYVLKKPTLVTRGGLRGCTCAGTDERKTPQHAGWLDCLFSEAMEVAFGHGLAHSSTLFESLRGLQTASSDLREAYQSASAERARVSAGGGVRVSWRGHLPQWAAVLLCVFIFLVFAVKLVS
ncbi:unnamed protein product [Ectocarpus sp. 8 AP-2014]